MKTWVYYLDKDILKKDDVKMDWGLGSIAILFIGVTLSLISPKIGFYFLSLTFLVFIGKIFLSWLWKVK